MQDNSWEEEFPTWRPGPFGEGDPNLETQRNMYYYFSEQAHPSRYTGNPTVRPCNWPRGYFWMPPPDD